jgi:hypothetical protein
MRGQGLVTVVPRGGEVEVGGGVRQRGAQRRKGDRPVAGPGRGGFGSSGVGQGN